MTFTSFLDNIYLNIKKNAQPKTILDAELFPKKTNILTEEKKISNKKDIKKKSKVKIKYRFVSSKEAKFAKEIGYSSKNQSPKQISDTLKLIPGILAMDIHDTKWTRELLYYSYSHIIDATIVVINGKRVLKHKFSNFSEYAHLTYKSLKEKVDNLIKKLKRNEYVSIGNHQKDYERYAKDFELRLTYSKILRKCNFENSSFSKEKLPQGLVNEKLSFEHNSITIFEKINLFFQKYFNPDRKKKYEYYKFYKDLQNQKNSIIFDLKQLINLTGIYDLKTEKGSKKMKYVWFKKFNNVELIRGDKKCKELYMEILRAAKQMKYHLSQKNLQDSLDHIKLKVGELSDILYSIGYDTFQSNPKTQESKQQKQKIIINSEFQQQEEKIVKLFNRKLCMSYALLKNFIFDHKKKIFKLKDGAGQRLIIEKMEQFQCMYENQSVIIRFDGLVYNFVA